jgi:hypothetical protein
MATERTESSRYQSLYGGGFVTPAQILSEVMCERMARSKGQSLPAKFWSVSEEWSKTFIWQLTQANKLLKEFHETVISRVLRSKEGSKFLSLTGKGLRPLLKKEQKKYEEEIKRISNSTTEEKVEIQSNAIVKPSFVTNKSKLSRLKGIDNE